MHIAIFDYKVTRNNPSGGCHRLILEYLCLEHNFTVFAVEFDNPCPDRIKWVRVRVPTRPLILLFLTYHLLAPIVYLVYKVRHRVRYDLVQRVENNLSFGQVGYIHFCHRAFLSHVWPGIGAKGVRAWLRWLDHFGHSFLEPFIYRRTAQFVVPSVGLQQEFTREYSFSASRIVRIPNPIDIEKFAPPTDFERGSVRGQYNFGPDDVVLVFSALGQFERKGLPLLLEALRFLPVEVKLMVVGGRPDLQRVYSRRAVAHGLRDRTVFLGMIEDVRPYLWAGDAFVFPSYYEVFSLSAHEAAAAGLPIIATPVYGLIEVFQDRKNAIFIKSTVESVVEGIRWFTSLSPAERIEIGAKGQKAVQHLAPSNFAERWRDLYKALGSDASAL